MDIEDRAPCIPLPWDTAFWGVPTARVYGDTLAPDRLQYIDAWCAEQQVRCLYFLARSDDANTIRLAEDNGFRLVDVRITFRGGVVPGVDSRDRLVRGGITVRPSVRDDLGALQAVARVSYRDTRFYYDAHFSQSRCDALYEAWVKQSCEGYADIVLVAELDAKVVGFISCRCDPETHIGNIGLVGVDSAIRGKGIGRLLVATALEWFASHGQKAASVVTQGRNIAAQRLYQRAGFLTSDVEFWYHKWYLSERP